MLILLGKFEQAFFDLENIFTSRKDQKQIYTKNQIQELNDKKV